MPKINNINQDETPPNMALLCLGYGKSAGAYISHLHPDISKLVLTDHPVATEKFQGLWGNHPYSQTGDLKVLKTYLRSQNPKTEIVIAVTTHPERGKEWLDRIMSDREIKELLRFRKPIFYLPQSPNPYLNDFAKHGTVIIGDYYMGIGGMSHDLPTQTSQVKVGIKENCICCVVPKSQEKKVQNIIKTMSFHQKVTLVEQPLQLALLPTNAILHSVGIACHIAESLTQIGAIDASIFSVRSAKEFFQHFTPLQGRDISELVGNSLKGKGFYRQMPALGPNIIMAEVSDIVVAIRQKLISEKLMKALAIDEIMSDGRSGAHVLHHLRGKYEQQFFYHHAKEVCSVSAGEFIQQNPPYQNLGIVFPTRPDDGTINIEHRFFTEEIPSLVMIYRLGMAVALSKKDLEPLWLLADFSQKLTGKEYLKVDGELGADAPEYLPPLKTFKDFPRLFAGGRQVA